MTQKVLGPWQHLTVVGLTGSISTMVKFIVQPKTEFSSANNEGFVNCSYQNAIRTKSLQLSRFTVREMYVQSLVVCDLKVWPELENVPKRQEKRGERGEGRGERQRYQDVCFRFVSFLSLFSPLFLLLSVSVSVSVCLSLSLSLSLSLLPRIESGTHWWAADALSNPHSKHTTNIINMC